MYSKISTDPGLPLKIRHSHRFVAVVIQILFPPVNFTLVSLFTSLRLFTVSYQVCNGDTIYTQKIRRIGSQCAGGLVVIEHARQADDPDSNPPTLTLLRYFFSVFTLFENNSKCLGDALSLMACHIGCAFK